jgi:hypothetical protein
MDETPDMHSEAGAGEVAIPEDLRVRYEAAKRTCNINEGQYIERIAKAEAENRELRELASKPCTRCATAEQIAHVIIKREAEKTEAAIQRAEAAEAALKGKEAEIERLTTYAEELSNTIAQNLLEIEEWKGQCEHTQTLAAEMVLLRAKLTTARAALDKLARLGNGAYFGNSDGNVIAQKALAATEEK